MIGSDGLPNCDAANFLSHAQLAPNNLWLEAILSP